MEFSVRVSFLELYNEELFDLLGSTEDPLRLRIYEDISKKVSLLSYIWQFQNALFMPHTRHSLHLDNMPLSII